MREFKPDIHKRIRHRHEEKKTHKPTKIPTPKPYIVLFANPFTPPKPNDLIQNYLIYTEPAIDPDRFFEEINKVYPDTKTVDLIRLKWGNNNFLVMLAKEERWGNIDKKTRLIIEAMFLDDGR